ncbi:MAG: 50S ribosomal protein L25 [Saprospiraceae bacterium]
MEIIAIKGQVRSDLGKKATKAVRKEGLVPCVMYGGKAVFHFAIDPSEVKTLIYSPDFRLVEIDIEGTKYKCIVKDAQFHPVYDTLVHLDFLRLVDGHKVNVEIPVSFHGSSPGIKLGGKLQQNLRRVKIKTTPEKLVGVLTLDISNLDLGQSIRVRDIDVVEGVEILSPPSTPVATIEIPRALRSAATAAAATTGKK